MKTKVAILGAGCSQPYGYPLAHRMTEHLTNFSEDVETSAPKLHKLTRQTLDLFDKLKQQGCHAQTLDDLAWLIDQGKFRELYYGREENLISQAKTVVSAMFLAKESEQVAKNLSGYRNFLRRIFPEAIQCGSALLASPWRILTFNYDRLFELAFRQHFDVDMSQTFYGPTVLNSGLFLVVPEQVQIDTNRFSLIKLHGSVGFYGMNEHGRCSHYHMIPDPAKRVSITDETFFFGGDHGVFSNSVKPSLIVFPHEKNHLKRYPNNTLPYRFYLPEIWRAARAVISNADEIWIIGYSVPEADWFPLESLLSSAPDSCQIIVQNPNADSIAARLRVWLPKFANRITPHTTTFEG
jgi:hypothetical protein